MILKLNNENYGYAVTTRDKWAAVGNPSFYPYPPEELGVSTSGSVDLFLYDKQSDTHVLKATFFRHTLPEEEILLAAETDEILHTEPTGSVPITANKDLSLDSAGYLSGSANDYGRAIDMHNRILGIGYTHDYSVYQFWSGSTQFTSSGGVDMYDMSVYDPDPISVRDRFYITNAALAPGGYFDFTVFVPPGYKSIALITSSDLATWSVIQVLTVDMEAGGTYLFHFPLSELGLFYNVMEWIDTDPYIMTLSNPFPAVTESFGWSVSVNDEWVAVGSPLYSESRGAVHMFRKFGGRAYANLSWSYHSTVTASDGQPGDLFGWSCELNDDSGFVGYSTKSIAFSQSLVVGTGRPSGSKVYYYEISGSGGVTGSIINARWGEASWLLPTYTNLPLTYYPELYPILSSSWAGPAPVADRFGHDVSIYGNTIAVGAPFDRYYYEYTQSSVYQQGAFYIFERCSPPENGWFLKMKSHGNEKSLKNHRMGHSLDLYEDKLVVGCPKLTVVDFGSSSITSCLIQGSLYQAHFCRSDLDYQIQGQFAYLQYNTESTQWEYQNVYQVKKRYLEPYRNFGYSIDTSDRFVIVGAPMNVSGSRRSIDVYYSGSDYGDFYPIGGQAYIYNYANYHTQFHIGNAFYRNGKIVLITSGSQFDGLFLNQVTDADYQYDLTFHNKQTLHEKQVICSVDPGEFNVSTNPTSIQRTGSLFDMNKNGQFDFQDLDILLMYMNWKRTEIGNVGSTDWSSSILADADEISWHNFLKYSGSFYGTQELYVENFAMLNTTNMYQELDFNQDNLIDTNDQNILWKYFANRLNQKNFDKYITVNSTRRLYGDIVDHLNSRTNRGAYPLIKSEFFDYERLSRNDVTGSYLTPYVTSIGLYQDGDLVAIAKLGSPIKLLPDYPYNFVVKMDF